MSVNDKESNQEHINVCSWNIWCIPFGSPRTFSNCSKCATYLLNMNQQQTNSISIQAMVDNQNESWYKPSGINILCLQELWSWRVGIFPLFILRLMAYVEYIPILGCIISMIFQLLSFISGLICQPCCNRKYNPKKYLARKMKDILPYHIYDGDIKFPRFLDNGLMILSDHIPTDYGSELYQDAKAEDYFAAKGFLWVYFADHELLIINTHLQAAGKGYIRTLQLKQMRTFVDSWKNKVEKIIVCGDFNMDMKQFRSNKKTGNKLFWLTTKNKVAEGITDTNIELTTDVDMNYIRQRSIASSIISNISHIRHSIDLNVNISTILQMYKISNFEPTFIDTKENIDHVLASWIPKNYKTLLFTDESSKLSDHKLLVVRM